ncbi:PKD domain-containing protein [Halosimplex litoreum]|uniref:PKD domain-containing protein n=1 Tax=Halosimplex litoreum TaxID=1198301 RepID=A0A7T3FZV1_9EURY|nr:PKD domain-containing protein [Halosimplex litoreum]QPV63622.1 PKD domain-containing protein [Halosimplex litoreum]
MPTRDYAAVLSLLLVGAALFAAGGAADAAAGSTGSEGFAVSVDDPTPEPHDSVTIAVDEATLPDGATLVWRNDGELGTNRCIRHANCTVRVGAAPVTVTVEAHVDDRVITETVEITPVELSLSETLVDRDGEALSSVGYRVLTGERLELRATDEVGSGATVANVSASGPVARVGAEPTAFEFTGPGAVELTVTMAATDRDATETVSLSFRAYEPGTLEDTERFVLRSAEPLSRNDRIVLAALKPDLPTVYERYEQRAGELPETVTFELAEPRARSYAVAPDTVVVANGKTVHGVRTTLVHELAHLGQYEATTETDGGWNFLIEGHASYEQSSTLPYYDDLSKPSEDALLEWTASYDQAHYFVASYVAEYGRQSLLDLLADSAGSDFERQFRAETGESFASFHERWMSGGSDDPAAAWKVFETKPMFASEDGTLRTLAEPLDGVEVSWDTDGDGAFERVDAGHAVEWTPPASGRQAVTVRFTAGTESIEGTQVLALDGGDPTPTAAFGVAPDSVAVGESVTFRANTTANSDDAAYRWDFDGDSAVEATGETVAFTYAHSGTYAATLTVEASDGATDSATVTLPVEEETQLPRDVVYEPGSGAAEYDADADGRIDIGELGAAADAFSSGRLTIDELGSVAEAFSAS